MEARKQRSNRPPAVGSLLARAFWLAVLGGSAWCVYEQRRLGEWPWSRADRLDGIELLSRSEWGAAKPDTPPARMKPPSRITIHHSGGNAAKDLDREAVERTIRAIQTDHIRKRGWSDIGYHFVIDRSGRIWEGRPVAQIGAHAGSQIANDRNAGVLLLGNFDVQTPAGAQISSLERLLETLRARYKIGRAQVLSHKEVRGDCGLGPTNCPGKYLDTWLESYRKGRAQAPTRVGMAEDPRAAPVASRSRPR